MAKRKICFITGTRADYGILKPVFNAVQKSSKLELKIIVTGMHLESQFGDTYKEIEKDGFKINKVKIDSSGQGKMAKEVGNAILKIAELLIKMKPDIVVVLGDRGEMLAAAIAANYLSIPVAHIHGGEISGHVDGVVRHVITKLSHLHFAATKISQERILKLGEEKWRVINSGAPGLDSILQEKLPDKEYLYKKYKIKPDQPLIILVQHPVLVEKNETRKQITESLNAVLSLKKPVIIIYPNSDEGSFEIIKEIEKNRNLAYVSIYKSIPHQDYLGLLSIANVLVGNSSSGIIEAASFRLPVVDIGSRQENRERGQNVIHADYNKKEIKDILQKILSRDRLLMSRFKKVKNPYGNGKASEKITRVLEETDLNKLINKKLVY